MKVSLSEQWWRHLSANCLFLMVSQVVAIVIIFTSSLAPPTEALKPTLSQSECQLDNFRLPQWLKPTHYELSIKPNLEWLTFSGKVAINIVIDREQRKKQSRIKLISRIFERKSAKHKHAQYDPHKIVLHAEESLQIKSAYFVQDSIKTSGARVQVREICRDKRNDLLVITLGEPIGDAGGQLKLSFAGKIRDDLHGFYRSEAGKGQLIAVTQFQAPHARKAFPCFDEPAFKATFALTLKHAAHLQALSNMQLIEEPLPVYRDDQNLLLSRFAPTPRMSTYLLAWAVGQFDHIETEVQVTGSSKPMKLAVWTSPGRAHEAQYALMQAARAYAALRNYFDIEQPLEKIDILAVRELDGGAMENWGLITFTEAYLFPDTNTATTGSSTPAELIYANDVITHELSHSWFGNLVTMRWWDDLWLNEGFATWITQQLNRRLHPEHDGQLVHLMDEFDATLRMDAKFESSHPIKNSQLQTVKQIEDSFDEITYNKGSAVLGMLNEFLGEEQFKRGIKRYLNAHLYGNTEARDLWESLGAEVGEGRESDQVAALMNSWVNQAGYPLISVSLSIDGDKLHLQQERFLLGATSSQLSEVRNQKWIIPVTMWVCCRPQESTGSDPKEQRVADRFEFTLNDTASFIRLPDWFNIRTSGWIKLNHQFNGFYRVMYNDGRLWNGLERALEFITPADRLNLINDLGAFYQSSRLTLRTIDRAIKWFAGEQNDAVINQLARLIAGLEIEAQPSSYDRTELLVRYYERTNKFNTVEDDSLLRTRTRGDVASLLVVLQNAQVISEAVQVFETRLQEVPRVFRSAIYAAVAAAGSEAQQKRMFELVKDMSTTRKERAQLEKYIREFKKFGAQQGQKVARVNKVNI